MNAINEERRDDLLPLAIGIGVAGILRLALTFNRSLVAGRVSLAIGLLAGLVAVVIGVLYGAAAGFIGGKTDEAMMRVVDRELPGYRD